MVPMVLNQDILVLHGRTFANVWRHFWLAQHEARMGTSLKTRAWVRGHILGNERSRHLMSYLISFCTSSYMPPFLGPALMPPPHSQSPHLAAHPVLLSSAWLSWLCCGGRLVCCGIFSSFPDGCNSLSFWAPDSSSVTSVLYSDNKYLWKLYYILAVVPGFGDTHGRWEKFLPIVSLHSAGEIRQ